MVAPCFPQPNLWLVRCASRWWTALKKFAVPSTQRLRVGGKPSIPLRAESVAGFVGAPSAPSVQSAPSCAVLRPSCGQASRRQASQQQARSNSSKQAASEQQASSKQAASKQRASSRQEAASSSSSSSKQQQQAASSSSKQQQASSSNQRMPPLKE